MKIGSLELKTKRLVIRPMRASDYALWSAAHLACRVSRNEWDQCKPASEITRAKFARNLRIMAKNRSTDKFYGFGIFLRSSGEMIGSMSLHDVQRGVAQDANVGYALFSSHWGQGYAREALEGMFVISFKRLGLHRLEAGIEPKNRRSIALARTVGMRKEGLQRRVLFFRKQWRDHLMFAITCEDLGWKYRGEKPALFSR